MNDTLIVRSEGGWASQLHCLSFALAHASRKGFKMQHHTGGGEHPRHYALTQLLGETELEVLDDWKPPQVGIPDAAHVVLRRLAMPVRRLGRRLVPQRVAVPPYSGDWHRSQLSEIRRRIDVALLPNFLNTDVVPGISVHVRLGDYASNAAARRYHGLVSAEYLAQALARIDPSESLPIYLFSEDPDRARRELIEVGVSDLRIDTSRCTPEDIWNDTFQMARGQHFIGCNSGVSLWVALAIAESPSASNRRALLPTPWFADPEAIRHHTLQGVPEQARGPGIEFFSVEYGGA